MTNKVDLIFSADVHAFAEKRLFPNHLSEFKLPLVKFWEMLDLHI